MAAVSDEARKQLEVPADEEAIQRLWGSVTLARRRRHARRKLVGGGMGVALATLLFAVWSSGDGEPAAPGPLRLQGGGVVRLQIPSALRTRFEDGSWVRTNTGTELEVLENTGQQIGFHLRSGQVEVEVAPGGPRRWVVEAGEASVQVVGTRFVVRRHGAYVRVAVERGAVVVRSRWLDDGVTRLEAGDYVEVGPPRGGLAAVESPPQPHRDSTALPASEEALAMDAPPFSQPASSADPVLALAEAARPRVIPDQPTATAAPEPAPQPAPSPETLLAEADDARLAGRPAVAALALERLLREHPGHPSVPLAALTLGRLELRSLHLPANAVRHLERALAAQPPISIASAALALLSDAHAAAGSAPEAAVAACEYVRRFPEGARRADMERACSRE